MLFPRLALICFALGLIWSGVSAAETVYRSQSAWQNAAGPLTSISLDASNWTYSVVPIQRYTIDDIATSISGPAMTIDHSNYLNGNTSQPLFVNGALTNGLVSDHDQYIFRFTTPIYAFGADFVFSNPDEIVAPAGQAPPVPMTTGFYGVTSDTAIAEIDLVEFGCNAPDCPGGPYTSFVMSNLRVESAPVPEPMYWPVFLVATAMSLKYRRILAQRFKESK